MLALLQLLLVVEISYTLNHVKNLVFFCTKSSLLLHQVSEIENRGFIFFFFLLCTLLLYNRPIRNMKGWKAGVDGDNFRSIVFSFLTLYNRCVKNY